MDVTATSDDAAAARKRKRAYIPKRRSGAYAILLALHREAVGSLVVDVELGAYRALSDEEIQKELGFTPRKLD